MLFSIFVALTVILITAYWVYQGFFSSVIMFLETVIACLIAFTFYESVNSLWAGSLNPGVGLPLALMLLFCVVLVGLRVATDKLIPGNVTFPPYVDRVGGGVFGFFTGMVLIGTALIGIQMIPLGSAVFFFERYATNSEGYPDEGNLSFLKPDRFTAGMVGMLSKTSSFGGDNPLNYAKPDLIEDLYSARAGVQTEARTFLPNDVLTVESYWETPEIDHVEHSLDGDTLVRTFESHPPRNPSNKFIVCRVQLDADAAKKGKNKIRFRVPQFRIVGPPPDPKGNFLKEPHVYLAIGMSDLYTNLHNGPNKVSNDQRARLVRFGPETNFILGPDETVVVAEASRKDNNIVCESFSFDVAFEVPIDFKPWYVEFKRGARVDLTNKAMEEETPDWASVALGDESPGGRVDRDAKVGRPPGGLTHLTNAIEDRTGVSIELPAPLPYANSKVQRFISGGRFRGGSLYVPIPEEKIDPAVTEFVVPPDKRLLQVGGEVLKAKSLLGRAMNKAFNAVAQYRVRNSNGKEYFAIGQYGVAEVGGELYFEIQYYPEAEMPERCMKEPEKVTRKAIHDFGVDKSKYGFLFLVDPGVKIVSFQVGNKDPQPMNIDVPN